MEALSSAFLTKSPAQTPGRALLFGWNEEPFRGICIAKENVMPLIYLPMIFCAISMELVMEQWRPILSFGADKKPIRFRIN
jgi:hypothetical protein